MIETKLLTIKEALKIVPLSRSGMWQAIKRGEVPSVRIGGRVFIVNANAILHNSGEEKMHESGEKSLWVSFK